MKLSDLIIELVQRLALSDEEVVGVDISETGKVTLAIDTGEDGEDEV